MLAANKRLLFIGFIGLALSACGKSADDSHVQAQENPAPVEGALVPIIDSLGDGKYATECDRSNFATMKKIAVAVDEHRAEIDAYSASLIKLQNSPNFKYVQMGPIVVREKTFADETSSVWEFSNYSWKTINDAYLKAVQDPSPQNWSVVNNGARGILFNDQSRVLHGNTLQVGYLDQPLIEAAHTAVEKCAADAACNTPAFAPEAIAWFAKQPDYSHRLGLLKSETDHAKALVTLTTLRQWLEYDLKRFAFEKNGSIHREGDILHVPLFAGPFASATEQLASAIETVWANPSLSVKIDWSPDSADFFSLVLAPGSGGRSYMNFSSKKVFLFDQVRSRSITHEIGHVLGFQDHYYDIWDAATCSYTEQTLPADLMSNSSSGLPTSDEWQQLQTTYPATATGAADVAKP
jgi:hypothetical protein